MNKKLLFSCDKWNYYDDFKIYHSEGTSLSSWKIEDGLVHFNYSFQNKWVSDEPVVQKAYQQYINSLITSEPI